MKMRPPIRRLLMAVGSRLTPLCFFAGLAVYLWLSFDSRLIYYAFGIILDFPSLNTVTGPVGRMLTEPGGAAGCVGALLAQGYYHAWLGSLIITAIAVLAWLGTGSLLSCFTRRRVSWLGYAPILILLVAYEGLENPTVEAVSFLIVLWGSALYCRLRIRSTAVCVSLLAVLNIILYAVVGPASLVFALLVAMHDSFVGRRPWPGFVSLLVGAAVPLLMALVVYDMPALDAYTRILPLVTPKPQRLFYVAAGLYLFLPVAVPLSLLIDRLKPRPSHTALALCASAILPFAAALLVIPISRNEYRRLDIRMAFLSINKMWPEMLEFARTLPPEVSAKPYFNHEICKALYYNGRLGYDLLSFPQKQGAIHLMGSNEAMPGTRYAIPFLAMADLSLGLGHLNRAEKLLYETLEFHGEAPMVLERLALINIAKRRNETASVLLHAMKKIPFHRETASTTLAQLQKDPSADSNANVQHLRSVMLLNDYVDQPGNYGSLTKLLSRNPSNRMAFEYLMAVYLLSGHTEDIVRGLERLNASGSGYEKLPRHYEEAMAVWELMTGKPVVIGNWRVSAETREKAHRFARTASELADQPDTAWSRLVEEFGDTYFFFLNFQRSGAAQ